MREARTRIALRGHFFACVSIALIPLYSFFYIAVCTIPTIITILVATIGVGTALILINPMPAVRNSAVQIGRDRSVSLPIKSNQIRSDQIRSHHITSNIIVLKIIISW